MNEITDLKYDNKYIYSSSLDKAICIWFPTGNIKQVLTGHTDCVNCIQLSGTIIVSGSNDSTIKIWNIKTNVYYDILLKDKHSKVTCIYLDELNQLIFVGTNLGRLYCIDFTTKLFLESFLSREHHKHKITSIKKSNLEDDIIYTSSMDGYLKGWNIKNGKLIYMYTSSESIINLKILNFTFYLLNYNKVTIIELNVSIYIKVFNYL